MTDTLTYDEISRLANDAQTEVSVGREIIAERDATIAALTRKIEELEKDWQPIETAPKDGTHILAYPVLLDVACVVLWEGNWAKGHWRVALTEREPPYQLTHWKRLDRPLPPPPVPDEGK